ncbi:hypothetical protein EIP91_011899 [Steccherinum ochraceum]|uniref:Hypervirulence associated protein TUDOR domain-containing protein n=1 Tax=Steccherinum ochraceum TaxID=92696 RepID=A0A4V2MWW3_9APHY|nr:hypothetical protein EIP91_011899 [Steccherinum ochraceum]
MSAASLCSIWPHGRAFPTVYFLSAGLTARFYVSALIIALDDDDGGTTAGTRLEPAHTTCTGPRSRRLHVIAIGCAPKWQRMNGITLVANHDVDDVRDDKLEEGQEVSWKWGSGNPSGKVAEIVTEGKAEVTSNKGNTIHKNARGEDDPAVKITRKGNDVVKLAHELNEVKDA